MAVLGDLWIKDSSQTGMILGGFPWGYPKRASRMVKKLVIFPNIDENWWFFYGLESLM
jgi:hypothetical protein